MNKNPFHDIYVQCNKACDNMEKYQKILNGEVTLPSYLDIEVTNHCNFNCSFCPTGTNVMKRKRGFMDSDVLDAICRDVKKYEIKGVRLIRWGEPMLHPDIINIIKKLKNAGALVHINTNGSLLTEEKMKELVEAELDSIKFSFQGVDEVSYNEMRVNGKFSEIIDKVRRLKEFGGRIPYIQISTTVTDETEEQIDQFRRKVENICDYYNIGYTKLDHLNVDEMRISEAEKERIRELKKRETISHTYRKICPDAFDKLSVNWNGDVTICCSDYDDYLLIGNILTQDLKEIFNSEKADAYRKIISKNEYEKLPICNTCFEEMKLIDL